MLTVWARDKNQNWGRGGIPPCDPLFSNHQFTVSNVIRFGLLLLKVQFGAAAVLLETVWDDF